MYRNFGIFKKKLAVTALLGLMSSLAFVMVQPVRGPEEYAKWGPRVDYTQLIIYGTYEAEVAALRAGSVDLIDWPLDYDTWMLLKDDPTFVVEPLTMYDCYDIDINNLKWPTSDYRFRKAIAHLIDYETFYTNILRAYAGELMDNIIWWEWTKWYNSLAPKYWYNTTLALSILADAGYQNWDADPELEWKAPNSTVYELPDLEFYARADDPLRNALGDMLNAELLAIGIPTHYVVASRSVCWGHAYKTPYNYHLYTAGMGPFPDVQFLYDYYHSKYATPTVDWCMNNVFFINDTYDHLVEELKFAADDASAVIACKEAQEVFMDQVPLIPVYHSAGAMAYRAQYGHYAGEEPYWDKPWKGVVNSIMPTTTCGVNDVWTLLNAHPEDVASGGVLRYGIMSDVDHVNPITVYSYWDSILLNELYSTLTARDPYTGEMLPWLADEWKVETWDYAGGVNNATKLTIKLHENLEWSDGSPLNSTDIAFTMKYMYDTASPSYYPYVETIDGINTTTPHIDTPDPNTVVIYYTVKSVWVLEWAGSTPIIPKHIWAAIDPKFVENKGEFVTTGNLTGSGPYVIAGYLKGQWWLLAPNAYYFRNLPPDVAITNVESDGTVVGQGFSTGINVTVTNQGEFTETFTVTAYAGTTVIGTKEITLTRLNTTTIAFTWNTTGFTKGNYTISATAYIPGEVDTLDNDWTDGWILVTKVGDLGGPFNYVPTFFACDGKVDGFDLALFIACYKELAPENAMYLGDLGGPFNYVPTFFACDGKVDGFDLALFIACYKGLGPDP